MDWTDGLSGIEWIFQRDNFGPDVTTAVLGILESVVGHKSSHHVGMRRNQDTPGTSDWVSMRAIVFIRPEGPQLGLDAPSRFICLRF
jgi:hypothetical protein